VGVVVEVVEVEVVVVAEGKKKICTSGKQGRFGLLLTWTGGRLSDTLALATLLQWRETFCKQVDLGNHL